MFITPSKTIGGREYVFYSFPARRLHKLKLRIVKHLARAFGEGLGDVGDLSKTDFMKSVDVGKILVTLSDTLEVDEMDLIYNEILCQTKVKVNNNGSIQEVSVSEQFDVVFMGDHFGDIEKVVFEALKVYFGNLLGGSFGSVTSLLSGVAKPTQ